MTLRLRLYFGSNFQDVPVLVYHNGITYKDMVDPDYLTLLDFNDIIGTHRYSNIKGWCCKLGGQNVEQGLRKLKSDTKLMEVE